MKLVRFIAPAVIAGGVAGGSLATRPAEEQVPLLETTQVATDTHIVRSIFDYDDVVLEYDDLIGQTTVLVRATAGQPQFVEPQAGTVWTRQTFTIEDVIWGSIDSTFELEFTGGITQNPLEDIEEETGDGPTLWENTEMPQFAQGGSYLLFLKQVEIAGELYWTPVGHGTGRYRVANDRLQAVVDPGERPAIARIAGRRLSDVIREALAAR